MNITEEERAILGLVRSMAQPLKALLTLVDKESAMRETLTRMGRKPRGSVGSKPRTHWKVQAGTVLTKAGCKNGNAVASAIKVVEIYFGRDAPSDEKTIQFWRENPAIEESVHKCKRLCGQIGVGFIAGMHFVFSMVNQADADRFVRDFDCDVSLSSADPVAMLREQVAQGLAEHGAMALTTIHRTRMIGLFLQAWNDRRDIEKSRAKMMPNPQPSGQWPVLK